MEGNDSYSTARPAREVRGRLFEWLDQRAGIRSLLREALDEPIPGGARLAYAFGSTLLFLFIAQAITGVTLALYYVPSADHAHTTVSYITKEVTSGSFLRSLHSYTSSAVIVVLLLHVCQIVIFGSYKGRREILWASGCVLVLAVAGMAFTGYLLPWDQKAYFATAVGTNVMSEVPLIGDVLKRAVRGGIDMGTLTISRFYIAHVIFIPAMILGLVAAHVYLFRKAGAAGPPEADAVAPQLPGERFYPRQVFFDVVLAVGVLLALLALSYVYPVELGPKADPSDTQYLPRPEWYYRPAFQWLKYWNEQWAVLGILVIPLVLASLAVGLPFIDRSRERRPRRRPVAVGVFAALLAATVGLGALSFAEDARDPLVASQLARQREETEAFTREPFEPELDSPSLERANVALADPVADAGKAVFEAQSCSACHGEGGEGTPAGPSLRGIGVTMPPETLASLLREPSPAMAEGGMVPLAPAEVPDADIEAIVAYLRSLKK